MLNTAGLSLEQAPPIEVPFRLFLTAPVFLLGAAIVVGWQGDAVFVSRWSPAALAVTHLIVIGFLGQIMCGALLQMLPVIAGAPVPAVRFVGSTVNLFLAAGATLLGLGFLGIGHGALTAGAVCSAIGFLTFLVAASVALTRAKGAAQTIRAMRFALASLLVTVIVGLLLIGALQDWISIPRLFDFVTIHLAWGLLGWVGLLVVGVAFQIVPMFYVTPAHPAWLTSGLAPVVAAALALSSLVVMTNTKWVVFAAFMIVAAAFTLFAAVTLWLLLRRERKRVDATLLHWWAAMACIAAAAIGWALGGAPELIGILLLFGVGVGLPAGMLFKIVPFLAWFHLQHRQLASGRLDVRVPNMLTFLPEKWARLQFAIHIATLFGLLCAWVSPVLTPLAGVALALTAATLGVPILVGIRRFRRIGKSLASASA